MRQSTSLFNRACEFINSVPVGETFTSAEYISAIGNYENPTWWKRLSKNKHYNCHMYKGYLKKVGFIKSIKRGEWMVQRHIPAWFDLGHLYIVLGYYKHEKETFKNILTYKGMDKAAILEKLKANSAVKQSAHSLANEINRVVLDASKNSSIGIMNSTGSANSTYTYREAHDGGNIFGGRAIPEASATDEMEMMEMLQNLNNKMSILYKKIGNIQSSLDLLLSGFERRNK